MSSARVLGSATALVASVLLASCGSGSDKSGHASVRLDRPVYPRCGTEGFAKPQVRQLSSSAKQGSVWALSYTRARTVRRPGRAEDTTTIAVVEFPPSVPRAAVPNSTAVAIGGRRVNFHNPDSKVASFAAQFKTAAVQYTVLANGTNPVTIKRLVACLP